MKIEHKAIVLFGAVAFFIIVVGFLVWWFQPIIDWV